MDNLYGSDNPLAAGNSNFIHYGWTDSYSARSCNHSGFAACHPGAEGPVIPMAPPVQFDLQSL